MYRVYLRGLIEISNRCRKNCLYCGIRAGNCKVRRYELSNEQILQASQFALDNGYGSVVLQAGERCDSVYVENIARLVYDITHLRSNSYVPLAVTLSLGEQSRDVYKLWHEAGAGRYLLRIEASDKELYERIHPTVDHSYDTRVECIENLKSLGYITGSGMMIGLPFQTRENLEHDIDFMVRQKIDMVGMGPYIPHEDTPLGQLFLLDGSKVRNNDKAVECVADECAVPLDHGKENCYGIENVKEAQADNAERICCKGEKLWGEFINYSGEEKVRLTIAVTKELRRRLPDVNIAATTALQVLSPTGREEAIKAGANVVMPNITLPDAKRDYSLYQGKTDVDDSPENVKKELERNLASFGCSIAWGEAGNPPLRH